MSFKTLLENKKVVTKSVDFAGEKVEIRKLSSGEVLEIQTLGRDISKATEGADEVDVEDASRKGIVTLVKIIKMGAIGADEVSDDDFLNFPFDDVQKLSDAILEYSGVNKKGK